MMLKIHRFRSFLGFAFLGISCFALAFIYAINPAVHTVFPSCPVNALTGLYCPGCGSLRGIHALMHGELATALRYNWLLSLGLIAALWTIVSFVPRIRRIAHQLPVWIQIYMTPRVLLSVVLVYTILRNLPWHPFNLLAPNGPSGSGGT